MLTGSVPIHVHIYHRFFFILRKKLMSNKQSSFTEETLKFTLSREKIRISRTLNLNFHVKTLKFSQILYLKYEL